MLLKVNHETRYVYDTPARGVVQSHRLKPSVFDGQRLVDWDVKVSDGICGGGFRDGAGDWVQGWSVLGPVSEITVTVQGTVEVTDLAGVLRGHRETTSPLCYLAETTMTQADAALADLVRKVAPDTSLKSAHAMSEAVTAAIEYIPGSTDAQTSAAEALAQGRGVCQDHAHALIAMARHVGMPARYVSGYLHGSADGGPEDASHAWAEIWIDGLGWVGFDPANETCPDERFIRLGSGLDARDAAPIRGMARGAAGETLSVTVAVRQADQ